MARMPGAIWQGEHGSRRMEAYDIVCVHTIVGYAPAHAAHFSVKADGTIIQSRDTKFQSAANLNGNRRVIAIENEDHGSAFGLWSGSDVPALTEPQVRANAAILRWAHETHGVPLNLCPNSRPGSKGLAYHRQGVDGNFTGSMAPGRVSGGEIWSSARGKVCPGERRINQLPEILRLARGEEALIMNANDEKKIRQIVSEELDKRFDKEETRDKSARQREKNQNEKAKQRFQKLLAEITSLSEQQQVAAVAAFQRSVEEN